MPSEDIFLGFEKEPEGLEQFLISEGYTSVDREDDAVTYERTDGPDVILFYHSSVMPVEDDEEVPNWEKAGFKILAELNVNFQPEYFEEAFRISEKTAEKFKAVLCGPNFEDYTKFD